MRTFIKGIINLWHWFPIIWRDRDWDHHFIEVILLQKLRNTYDFFISEHAVTDWGVANQDKALQALKICIEILERKHSNFYLDVYHNGELNFERAEMIYSCEDRDMVIFGKLFGKYLPYWWD